MNFEEFVNQDGVVELHIFVKDELAESSNKVEFFNVYSLIHELIDKLNLEGCYRLADFEEKLLTEVIQELVKAESLDRARELYYVVRNNHAAEALDEQELARKEISAEEVLKAIMIEDLTEAVILLQIEERATDDSMTEVINSIIADAEKQHSMQ